MIMIIHAAGMVSTRKMYAMDISLWLMQGSGADIIPQKAIGAL